MYLWPYPTAICANDFQLLSIVMACFQRMSCHLIPMHSTTLTIISVLLLFIYVFLKQACSMSPPFFFFLALQHIPVWHNVSSRCKKKIKQRMNHCCMMTDSYFDVSHSTLRCTCSESPFKVEKKKKQPVKWNPHKNVPGVVSLTAITLLCFQAWDPAESPGECTSSPAAPSASPWAGRAPGAGGGDPGLRRWGARRPRRLLQRSDRATRTNTNAHCPRPSLSLSTSVALSSTMASLSCCDRRSSGATSRLFGCCQKNERQCFCVSCCGSGCQRLCCLLRGLFSLCGSVSMLHPFCQQCGQMSLNICTEICAATSYMFFCLFFFLLSIITFSSSSSDRYNSI